MVIASEASTAKGGQETWGQRESKAKGVRVCAPHHIRGAEIGQRSGVCGCASGGGRRKVWQRRVRLRPESQNCLNLIARAGVSATFRTSLVRARLLVERALAQRSTFARISTVLVNATARGIFPASFSRLKQSSTSGQFPARSAKSPNLFLRACCSPLCAPKFRLQGCSQRLHSSKRNALYIAHTAPGPITMKKREQGHGTHMIKLD